jgi:nucleoid DNA-binding protein
MPEKKPAAAKSPTTVEVYTNIAQKTGLAKKQVHEVLEALKIEIFNAVSKKGPGVFNLMKLMKIQRVFKPATKERMVRNPATGEMVLAKAKPAKNVIKVRPLKPLKDIFSAD